MNMVLRLVKTGWFSSLVMNVCMGIVDPMILAWFIDRISMELVVKLQTLSLVEVPGRICDYGLCLGLSSNSMTRMAYYLLITRSRSKHGARFFSVNLLWFKYLYSSSLNRKLANLEENSLEVKVRQQIIDQE